MGELGEPPQSSGGEETSGRKWKSSLASPALSAPLTDVLLPRLSFVANHHPSVKASLPFVSGLLWRTEGLPQLSRTGLVFGSLSSFCSALGEHLCRSHIHYCPWISPSPSHPRIPALASLGCACPCSPVEWPHTRPGSLQPPQSHLTSLQISLTSVRQR